MDVIITKIESIERCINRINEVYQKNDDNLLDFTMQDSIILNLQRASELSIDIANYTIAKYKFQIPKTSRDAFEILFENKVIEKNISTKMQKMIGFRNIAIHEYKSLDFNILKSILKNNLSDFEDFYNNILDFMKKK